MTELVHRILAAAGAVVADFALTLGTAIASKPVTAPVAILGAEHPVKLGRVAVIATPLPETHWA